MLVVTACGSTADGSTTTSTATSTDAPAEAVVPRQLEDLDLATLQVGDREMLVSVADTPAARSTGLMFITELDDLDGMVFVYQADTTTLFHMLNTLIPLDIAFFGADGLLVSKTSMVPCETDTCPKYPSEGPYRYAIEAPAGAFDWVDSSTVLDVEPLTS